MGFGISYIGPVACKIVESFFKQGYLKNLSVVSTLGIVLQ